MILSIIPSIHLKHTYSYCLLLLSSKWHHDCKQHTKQAAEGPREFLQLVCSADGRNTRQKMTDLNHPQFYVWPRVQLFSTLQTKLDTLWCWSQIQVKHKSVLACIFFFLFFCCAESDVIALCGIYEHWNLKPGFDVRGQGGCWERRSSSRR